MTNLAQALNIVVASIKAPSNGTTADLHFNKLKERAIGESKRGGTHTSIHEYLRDHDATEILAIGNDLKMLAADAGFKVLKCETDEESISFEISWR